VYSNGLAGEGPRAEVPARTAPALPRIGIHTSTAGHLAESLDRASKLGANCLQIFSFSPRMWGNSPRIIPADAARFRERRAELALTPLVIHANYLINLATPNPILRVRSVQAFRGEIIRALDLDAEYLVLHPGSRVGGPLEPALAAVADGLRQAARGLDLRRLRILLENTAGQGSVLGSRFEELATMMALTRNESRDFPLGVCLDTAHLLAAGFEIRSAEGLDETLQAIERTVGLSSVHVIHVNDSKAALGARVDRHEHIGKGHIKSDAFARIVTHPLLAGRAFVLETPIDKPGDDRRNVQALWTLAASGGLYVPPRAEHGFTMFRGPRRKPVPARAEAHRGKVAGASAAVRARR
jgi:deoxyribonuclease-4